MGKMLKGRKYLGTSGGLVNAREIVEKFHRENQGMPGPNLVE